MFDIIVFTQNELINAVRQNFRAIGLCDNTFKIPLIPCIQYTAIGETYAEIDCTKQEAQTMNIEFIGITPFYSKINSLSSFYGSVCCFGEFFEGVLVNGYGIDLI